jgi:ribosomal protein L15
VGGWVGGGGMRESRSRNKKRARVSQKSDGSEDRVNNALVSSGPDSGEDVRAGRGDAGMQGSQGLVTTRAPERANRKVPLLGDLSLPRYKHPR